MLATTHISTRATPRLVTWLVIRATLWSDAENRVTRPTPAIASAMPKRKLSTLSVNASHSRERKVAIGRPPSVALVVGDGRHRPGRRRPLLRLAQEVVIEHL